MDNKTEYKKAPTGEDAEKIEEKYEDKPHATMQMKGTDICMDIHCVCGAMPHLDANNPFFVKCENCNRVYYCNPNIELIEIEAKAEKKNKNDTVYFLPEGKGIYGIDYVHGAFDEDNGG